MKKDGGLACIFYHLLPIFIFLVLCSSNSTIKPCPVDTDVAMDREEEEIANEIAAKLEDNLLKAVEYFKRQRIAGMNLAPARDLVMNSEKWAGYLKSLRRLIIVRGGDRIESCIGWHLDIMSENLLNR